MKKEYTLLATILISFTVVTAGAVILLTHTQRLSGAKKSLSSLPKKIAGEEVDGFQEGGLGSNYSVKFLDKYGVPSKSTAKVAVHAVTGKTTYTISVAGLATPVNNGKYFAWLQTAEGARTKLDALEISRSGDGTLEAFGPAPKEDWFLIVTYIDDSMESEDLILRGTFSQ